jgi:hypothetical protein
VSLRYGNELMLLRLGADAVIRQDVPLNKWPGVLSGLQSQPPRPKPDLDVQTALANAASPQGKGYLEIPGFLAEVESALERGHALGVPFALAVLHTRPDQAIADGVASAQCRRKGDFLTTDGEKLFVFFNACSLTRGPQVLESIFEGMLPTLVAGIDWMASEIDIQQLMKTLKLRHEQRPFQLALQPTNPARPVLTAPEAVVHALFSEPPPEVLPVTAVEPPIENTPTETPVAADHMTGLLPVGPAEAHPFVAVAPLMPVVESPVDEPVAALETPASEALHNRAKEAAVLNRVRPTDRGVVSLAASRAAFSRANVEPVNGPWVATSARSSLAARMSEARPLRGEAAAVQRPVVSPPTPPVRLAASRMVEPPAEPGVGDLLRRLAAPPEPPPKKATRFGGHF